MNEGLDARALMPASVSLQVLKQLSGYFLKSRHGRKMT